MAGHWGWLGSCPGPEGLAHTRFRAGGVVFMKPALVRGGRMPWFREVLPLAESILSWKFPSIHLLREEGRRGPSHCSSPPLAVRGAADRAPPSLSPSLPARQGASTLVGLTLRNRASNMGGTVSKRGAHPHMPGPGASLADRERSPGALRSPSRPRVSGAS